MDQKNAPLVKLENTLLIERYVTDVLLKKLMIAYTEVHGAGKGKPTVAFVIQDTTCRMLVSVLNVQSLA